MCAVMSCLLSCIVGCEGLLLVFRHVLILLFVVVWSFVISTDNPYKLLDCGLAQSGAQCVLPTGTASL